MLSLRPWAILAVTIPPIFAAGSVRIDSGLLSGEAGRDAQVRVYKGIPYAAPPVDALRWKGPNPVPHWSGVRAATSFSANCMQSPYPARSVYHSDPEPVSEDCLYLNVWTAANSSKDKRPVMVWIHGGALTRGSGSTPTYDGGSLAKRGVVVVTINYRLGVFGFLAHPDLTRESDRNASGNYGLLDQIAALEWVHRNIAAFGGDPRRVTIFGESAGSWSVNYLVATPLAKGLFERAIGESGGAFGPMVSPAEAEQRGKQFAKKMGADSIEALRKKPAADVLNASEAMQFPPNVDGWMLPQDVYSIFASGKQNPVPVIVGYNADEGTALAPWPAGGTAQTFVNMVRSRFGAAADAILKVYPAGDDEQAKASYYASFRDYTFGWQMREWAKLTAESGKSNAWLYYFSRSAPGPLKDRLGAFHASEIAYVFENLHSGARQWDGTDRALAETMSSYWVNFAKTGDPNGKGLPAWPAYTPSNDTALDFGDTVKTVSNLHKPALDFIEHHFESIRRTGQQQAATDHLASR